MTKDSSLPMVPPTGFGRVFLLFFSLAVIAGAQDLSCPAQSRPGSKEFKDFSNQTINQANFSYQDLRNADFSGAELHNPYFAYADLTNANFRGARIISDDTNPAAVSDFSSAKLEKTCFIGAKFEGLTYFTNAALSCADFSKVDLSGQNVMFGDGQLVFDRGRKDCRLAFRFAKMDCEFFNEWRYLDLAGADVAACASQFTGQDFSGAKLNNVNLKGANLNGTKFVRAELSQANLEKATLIGADLSYASLFGAHLDYANLTNATLYHAFLTNDTSNGIRTAASLQQAHLKNTNLAYAQLTGVNMTNANFYGDNPASTRQCTTARSLSECRQSGTNSYEGFTCGCASAHGATLRQTNLSDAYLYGVDFTDATIQAADFRQAVLTGANLRGAEISSDPQRNSDFSRAFLQGTSFTDKIEGQPNLSDAFVDFRRGGNVIFILLDGKKHNVFACDNCSPGREENVCVDVTYYTATIVPGENVSLRCPSGGPPDSCGPADSNGSNTKWKSRITDLEKPPAGIPPAAYEEDSTYIKKLSNPESICGNAKPMQEWPEQGAR